MGLKDASASKKTITEELGWRVKIKILFLCGCPIIDVFHIQNIPDILDIRRHQLSLGDVLEIRGGVKKMGLFGTNSQQNRKVKLDHSKLCRF